MICLTKEQRLLLLLILKSNISWDGTSLTRIKRWIGARELIQWEGPSDPFHVSESLELSPLVCIGCNNIEDNIRNYYPTVLTSCPNCSSLPLQYKGQYLYRGEAKLKYIYDAFFWPSIHVMHLVINQLIQEIHDHDHAGNV